jgi:hypothetical protein
MKHQLARTKWMVIACYLEIVQSFHVWSSLAVATTGLWGWMSIAVTAWEWACTEREGWKPPVRVRCVQTGSWSVSLYLLAGSGGKSRVRLDLKCNSWLTQPVCSGKLTVSGFCLVSDGRCTVEAKVAGPVALCTDCNVDCKQLTCNKHACQSIPATQWLCWQPRTWHDPSPSKPASSPWTLPTRPNRDFH